MTIIPLLMSLVNFNSHALREPVTEETALDQLIQLEIESGIDTEDGDTDEDVLALRGIPPDALLVLLRFMIGAGNTRKRWRLAQLKLCTLAHCAGMETVGDKSLTALAKELDCTRSLLSLYAIRLADQLGMNQVRGGRSKESRESYRQRAIVCHTRAGHNITTKQTQARPQTYME